MQATHYIPDEIERAKGHREECSMKSHYDFAEEALGEKRKLTQPQVVQQGHTMFHDLLVFTSDRQWIFLVWAFEIFWLLFVITVASMEVWGSCAFDITLFQQHTFCNYCYSNAFLLFIGVLVLLWAFNLYTYVLLLTRGFQLKLRFLGLTVESNTEKGIPSNAILLFLTLSALQFIWVLIGIVILFNSGDCLRDGMVYGNKPGRSVLLMVTCILSIILAPTFFYLGRCDDAKYFLKSLA
mmetsp:Transcript_116958/g.183969  ORF Transcript_116958/g.183969 Transcript_116958/m.183969 type:complete len:239 (-) Transcript_116958:15-731(-)|eukprot:CAMPEP_0169062030 /NCGR_PEP_ID=MMETSP1015-20121227/455_1 /TAXON_ID=342587 /ORGANISM="Karlodinium micrum, Strain CCMP2283" /LENGTH=238 /DNA_ID=CAMNT_0009120115 /DNA_START=138 /DNA_END=854 /DNA_ORIENTATION=+